MAADHYASGSGTGTYGLTAFTAPTATAPDAGGDAGPLVNGQTASATISAGDLDVFTITASQGGSIYAAMSRNGASLTGTFIPELTLFDPTGKQLDSNYNSAGAAYSGTSVYVTNLTLSGTY